VSKQTHKPTGVPPDDTDVNRLTRMHRELSELRQRHGSCSKKTVLFGAIGGILLALACVGSFQYVVSQKTDWSKNPISPVYQLAKQSEKSVRVPLAALLLGYLGGLAMVYQARKNFSLQEHLWVRENLLILEIRQLRDKLYPRKASSRPPEHSRLPAQPIPLQADEARGEYLGVYSPPGNANPS
jgi:hypothetical protein